MTLETGRIGMTGACCRTGLHVFHAFNDMDEGVAVAAHFFASGAAAGDPCLFYGDASVGARIIEQFVPGGQQGATPLLERSIVVAPSDVFDGRTANPVSGLMALRDGLVLDAVARGRRVRMVTMAAANAPDAELWDRTDAMESMFIGRAAPPEIVTALCMYDRRRYPENLIELARAAHPWCIADGRIVRNAFHDSLLSPRSAPENRVA